ncbi:MAG: LPS export ABC transporter periplasmic protein LptC [Marivita sp.]|uniref:LPS export ABC transporter periplasmic protein LptC n=1 Tax=Marivita sp. TaxID=2003365 RepID=UPI003EF0EEB2
MYSRLIAWLKILFPLGALVLLSTIFLYSRGPDPIATIPVLTGGADPTRTEQVGGPFYAGTTESGQGLTLSARQARLSGPDTSGMIADDVQAVIDIEDGNRIVIDATVGQVENGDTLILREGVTLQSSSGYTVRTDGLTAAMDRVAIESTGTVEADGPGLTLTAGKLRVDDIDGSAEIQLLFTDGVKLLYTPQQDEAE